VPSTVPSTIDKTVTSDKKPKIRDWYSVSTSALRRGGVFLTLLVVAAVGSFVYSHWDRARLQVEAGQVISQADRLLEELGQRGDSGERRNAVNQLEQAHTAYDEERYGDALDSGRLALALFESILQIGKGGGEGKIRFLSVSGNVEYRRGERGAWRRARPHDNLGSGDWVKTASDSTAEIVFGDGALYTLRQNTMMKLEGLRGAQSQNSNEPVATELQFGWVELNTGKGGRTLSTPNSRARVDRASKGLVTYDENEREGSFAAFEGRIEVTSESGQVRTLNSLELVEQKGDLLSEVRDLPDRPVLLEPADEHQFDSDEENRFQLAWRPVDGAARYALQVAPNRSFAPRTIDVDNRRRTRATLGIRGEGSFYWQVAAIDRKGERGPWSELRSFRIASLSAAGREQDTEPPILEIRAADQYGSVLILSGRTEPGAKVTIDGEEVAVDFDGTFKKTVQLTREGRGVVEIVAIDPAGNQSKESQQVFVDAL